MKRIILKYGLLASIITVGVPAIGLFLMPSDGDKAVGYSIGEYIGYGSIIVSMVFIFLGMKKFRDEENNGRLSFLKAIKVGLLIAVIPSLGFGIYNYVYIEYIDPGFMDSYYENSIEQMRDKLPADEFEAHVTKMEAEKEIFMSPVAQFVAMFFTVFLIGIIATLISSLVLKKDIGAAEKNLSVD